MLFLDVCIIICRMDKYSTVSCYRIYLLYCIVFSIFSLYTSLLFCFVCSNWQDCCCSYVQNTIYPYELKYKYGLYALDQLRATTAALVVIYACQAFFHTKFAHKLATVVYWSQLMTENWQQLAAVAAVTINVAFRVH